MASKSGPMKNVHGVNNSGSVRRGETGYKFITDRLTSALSD